MYIKSIEIENFRGFKKKTEIEFKNGINVLIGSNNAGKTTILKSLELLFSSKASKKLQIDDFNQNIDIDKLKMNPPQITILAKLIESDDENEYSEDLVSIASWLTKIEKPYEAQITFKFSLSEKYREDYIKHLNEIDSQDPYIYWKEIENEFLRKYTSKIYVGNPEYEMLIDSDSLKSFDFQFLTAIRDVERDLLSGSNTLLKDVIDFFMDYSIKTDSSKSSEEKKSEIKKLKKEFSASAKTLIENLQTRMLTGKKEILKYVDKTGANFDKINPDFDGRILDTELYSALKLIVETETGIKLPATKNGLGYNNLIYISLLLAKMQKDSSQDYLGSNAKNFSILAFEEPEAHLHPNMQYKLLKFLENNKQEQVRQIFITTHSPNITAAVNLESIISLSKIDKEIKISYPSRVFFNDKNSKKYVERFLDVTKTDMFFAKNIIFVEGLAEQILLPIFAEKLNLSLEDRHISIINVNGRYFDHFLKLFDCSNSIYAIQKKVVCITDKDSVKKEKNKDGAAWKSCYQFELNLDNENFEYEAISNKLVNTDFSRNTNIKVFSQKYGSTFEYELIFENYKNDYLITDSVSSKEHILEMMRSINNKITKNELNEYVNKIKSGSNLKILTEKYINNKHDVSSFEKGKHIIASRYLSSIKKGEIAQELSEVIYDSGDNFTVPTYIKEALEWICQED